MKVSGLKSGLLMCATILVAHAPLPSRAETQSTDGQWRAGVDHGTLVIFAQDEVAAFHRRSLIARDGHTSQSAAILAHGDPFGFVLALEDAPELWFIALDPDAGPFHQGFVHSYIAGMEESLVSEAERFARMRIDLTAPLVALRPDPEDRYAIEGLRADQSCVRVHLIAKREIGPCLIGDVP